MKYSWKMVIAIVAVIVVAVGVLWIYYDQLEQQTPKTLVVGVTDKITSLDNVLGPDSGSVNIIYNIYDTLYRYIPGTVEVEPCLADGWPEVSEDRLSAIVNLKEGIKFHDGTPFNASCVVFQWDRAIEESRMGYLFDGWFNECEIVDDYTIRIKLNYAFSPFLDVLSNPGLLGIPSPTAVVKLGDDFGTNPVATGPFKFVSWTMDEQIVLEANNEYFRGPPKVDKVVFRLFADSTTLKLAVQEGDVDIARRTISPADLEDLKTKDNLTVIEKAGLYVRHLPFNYNVEPFDDIRVRQAIAFAIDREAIISQVFKGTVSPTESTVPPTVWSYTDSWAKYTHNVTKAKELLTEAGYLEGLTIELWYTPSHYGETEGDVAVLIQSDLAEAGITVDLQYLEWSTFITNYYDGSMGAMLLGWYPDYVDPDDYTHWFYNGYFQGTEGTTVNSTELNAKLDQARRESDISVRTTLYQEIQEILADECPVIPLCCRNEVSVVRDSVQNYEVPLTFIDLFQVDNT